MSGEATSTTTSTHHTRVAAVAGALPTDRLPAVPLASTTAVRVINGTITQITASGSEPIDCLPDAPLKPAISDYFLITEINEKGETLDGYGVNNLPNAKWTWTHTRTHTHTHTRMQTHTDA